MPTSIAATIVAVISVFSVLLFNHEASAADVLKERAAANQAYKGWIHAKAEQIPPPERGGPRATGLSIHINPGKQIYVKVMEHGKDRTIEWIDRDEGVYQQYTSANNQLIMAELPSTPRIFQILELIKARKDLTAQALTGLLVTQPTMDSVVALVDYGCIVTRREEAAHERFDLAMPAKGEPFLTMLFDKQTKLLQRWSGTGTADGTEAAFSYTYGEPDLKSIRDLGVPPEAKVIDQRKGEGSRVTISPQAKAILDRLDGRLGVNEKLGNYIAIETLSVLADDGQSYKANMLIYGRSGDKRFFGRYWKISQRKVNLDGWPTPGIAAVHSAQGERPDILFASDGSHGWFAYADGTIKPWNSGLNYSGRFLLSGAIWPGRWCIDEHGDHRLRVDVQDGREGQYPGLKVVASGYAGIMPNGGFDRVEEQWQLDPARDDVPVASSRILRAQDGSIFEETQTRYLDHAQLPGGWWYPTRWRAKSNPTAGKPQSLTVEHRLQVFPGQELDPVWFTDPELRFGKP